MSAHPLFTKLVIQVQQRAGFLEIRNRGNELWLLYDSPRQTARLSKYICALLRLWPSSVKCMTAEPWGLYDAEGSKYGMMYAMGYFGWCGMLSLSHLNNEFKGGSLSIYPFLLLLLYLVSSLALQLQLYCEFALCSCFRMFCTFSTFLAS